MPRRFSRLREANRLSDAYTAYRAWDDSRASRVPRVGQGTPRPPAVELAISPFGFELPAATAVRGTCLQNARTQMGTAIGANAPVASGAVTLQRIPGFKPARITMFVGTGGRTEVRSEITNLLYLKYAGTSVSHPFGAVSASDLEYDEFTRIRSLLIGPNRRVSYKAEQRQVIV